MISVPGSWLESCSRELAKGISLTLITTRTQVMDVIYWIAIDGVIQIMTKITTVNLWGLNIPIMTSWRSRCSLTWSASQRWRLDGNRRNSNCHFKKEKMMKWCSVWELRENTQSLHSFDCREFKLFLLNHIYLKSFSYLQKV